MRSKDVARLALENGLSVIPICDENGDTRAGTPRAVRGPMWANPASHARHGLGDNVRVFREHHASLELFDAWVEHFDRPAWSVVAGPASGWYFIDVDPDTLATGDPKRGIPGTEMGEVLAELPETPVVVLSGGEKGEWSRHYWYPWRPNLESIFPGWGGLRQNVLCIGVDVPNLAPLPGAHPHHKTRRHYKFLGPAPWELTQAEIDDIETPPFLLRRVRMTPGSSGRQRSTIESRWVSDMIASGEPRGSRNTAATRMAMFLASRFPGEDDIVQTLMEKLTRSWDDDPEHPFTVAEVGNIARRACTKRDDKWPKVDAKLHLPEFPTRTLFRGPFAEYIEEHSRYHGVDEAMIGMLMLAAVSRVAHRSYVAQITSKWREVLGLYVLVGAGSGSRKSETSDGVDTMIPRLRRTPVDTMRREWLISAQEELKHLRRPRKKKRDLKRQAQLADAISMLRPYDVRLTDSLENLTPEFLHTLLCSERFVDLQPDEGAEWFRTIMGRYGSSPNVGTYCSAWRGKVRAQGTKKYGVESPEARRIGLTITLLIQREILREMRIETLAEQGLLHRFMFAISDTTEEDEGPLPRPSLAKRIAAKLRAIRDYPIGRQDLAVAIDWPPVIPNEILPQTLRRDVPIEFSARAQRVLKDFSTSTKSQTGVDTLLRPYYKRLPAQVARVAALIHLCEADADKQVNAATVERAMDFAMNFLIPHVEAAFTQAGAGGAESRARRIWEKMQGADGPRVRKSKLMNELRYGVKAFDEAANMLEERGFISIDRVGRASGRGRKAIWFERNPNAPEEW